MINQRVLWVTAFASLLPGWAVSDPPIPFGGWSVNNGVVTAGCASTAQCSTPTVMPGLYQRELTGKADGRQYVQSIMPDSGANGLPGRYPSRPRASFCKVVSHLNLPVSSRSTASRIHPAM